MRISHVIAMLAGTIVFLIPLSSGAKNLLPGTPPVPVPQKAATPNPLPPAKKLSPADIGKPAEENPVVKGSSIRNIRLVPGGKEEEVVLTGRNLDRITSAKVIRMNKTPVKEIGATILEKTAKGARIRFKAKEGAREAGNLSLRLFAGTESIDVPLFSITVAVQAAGKTAPPAISSPTTPMVPGKTAEIPGSRLPSPGSTAIPVPSAPPPALPPPVAADPGKIPPPGPTPGGGRGPGAGGHVPTPEMIEEVRRATARCPEEGSRPVIRFAADKEPWETLSTDTVTLRWQVRAADGSAWTQPVYLNRDELSLMSGGRTEVAAIVDSWPLRVADHGPRNWSYTLETLCGSAHVTVGWLPGPVVERVPLVTCVRELSLASGAHLCPRLRIEGHGFGSDRLAYRRISITGSGDTVRELSDIESWSNDSITVDLPDEFPRGSYRVNLSRGTAPDHTETASGSVDVAWQSRVRMDFLGIVIEGMFGGATIRIHNLGEYSCGPKWAVNFSFRDGALVGPSGETLSNSEFRERISYCASLPLGETPRDEWCVVKSLCSRYENDSYFQLTDQPAWPFEVYPVRMHNIVLGTVHYFVTDINSNSVRVNLLPNGNIRTVMTFESAGREFRGYSTDRDGGTAWPDGHIDGMSFVVLLEPTIEEGQLTYRAGETQFSGAIQARGICNLGPDICDRLFDYKRTISTTVERTFREGFNNETNQRRLKETIAGQLRTMGIGRIERISFEGGWAIIDEE